MHRRAFLQAPLITVISKQPQYYHAWPTMARRANGELVIAYSGGREGHVVEILARGKTKIAGQFRRDRGIDFVRDSADSRVEVLIPRGQSGGAKPNDIVAVEVTQHPTKSSLAIGRVVEVVGRMDEAGIETEVAMLAHGIPRDWPQAALDEARSWPADVPAKAKEGREDLRHVPLVTIDGADARDFDDAVFCERQGEGWRLIVAIADVSYYVRADSPLDREARLRGTSVYFPDRVVPMLPQLTNHQLAGTSPRTQVSIWIPDTAGGHKRTLVQCSKGTKYGSTS